LIFAHKKFISAHTKTKINDISRNTSFVLKIEAKSKMYLEVNQMANRSNRVEVPEAKDAMDRFKTEVASELGVNLKNGYNGDLTSKEAGSIGGEMVRRMIKKQEESMK